MDLPATEHVECSSRGVWDRKAPVDLPGWVVCPRMMLKEKGGGGMGGLGGSLAVAVVVHIRVFVVVVVVVLRPAVVGVVVLIVLLLVVLHLRLLLGCWRGGRHLRCVVHPPRCFDGGQGRGRQLVAAAARNAGRQRRQRPPAVLLLLHASRHLQLPLRRALEVLLGHHNQARVHHELAVCAEVALLHVVQHAVHHVVAARLAISALRFLAAPLVLLQLPLALHVHHAALQQCKEAGEVAKEHVGGHSALLPHPGEEVQEARRRVAHLRLQQRVVLARAHHKLAHDGMVLVGGVGGGQHVGDVVLQRLHALRQRLQVVLDAAQRHARRVLDVGHLLADAQQVGVVRLQQAREHVRQRQLAVLALGVGELLQGLELEAVARAAERAVVEVVTQVEDDLQQQAQVLAFHDLPCTLQHRLHIQQQVGYLGLEVKLEHEGVDARVQLGHAVDQPQHELLRLAQRHAVLLGLDLCSKAREHFHLAR
mmetsp:Transcript_37520/g.94321  ORF Transcript_37520/g.94321 Transcript_37520/m.94321 type:complete len:480 (+) Transcript_37520:49-1488(+)